jgi:hypothetical protein
MMLALNLGDDCLAPALDAAETVGAKNSLERMAAHQLAALHIQAMRSLSTGNILLDRNIYNPANTVEGSRMLNTAARLIKVYQEGLATLAKIRSGGRQVVTVQHVTVNDGGPDGCGAGDYCFVKRLGGLNIVLLPSSAKH